MSETGYKCILYGELYTHYLGKIRDVINRTNSISSNSVFSKKGDVLLPLSGETPLDISNSAVVPEDNVVLGSDLLVLRPSRIIDPLFLSFYISNCKKKEIARKACGISIIHSHKSDIEKLTINYPSIEEQKKISSLIDLIDLKMLTIQSKIETLKKYKEGLCNNLFKDGKNSKIALATLVYNCPSQLLTKDIEKNNGIFPVYDASGKPFKHINFYQQDKDCVSIIKYGSGCGRTFLASGKHSVLGTMTELKPKNINPLFIYAFTISQSFRRIVKKYTEIGTTPNLYFSDYGKAVVSESALSNENKIVTIINDIECKQSKLQTKLLSLSQFKNFLLKNLFI